MIKLENTQPHIFNKTYVKEWSDLSSGLDISNVEPSL